MKLIVGFGSLLAGLAVAWIVLAQPSAEDVSIDLEPLHLTQPDGCDVVIKPKWFGATSGIIADEIAKVPTGARICISSGEYDDALRVVTPVEIIGFGKTAPIIASKTAADVVQWHAHGGLLENLILLQVGGEPSGSHVTGQNGSAIFREGQPAYFADEVHSGPTIVNGEVIVNNVGIQNNVFSGVFVA
jgi:hypothetical protein